MRKVRHGYAEKDVSINCDTCGAWKEICEHITVLRSPHVESCAEQLKRRQDDYARLTEEEKQWWLRDAPGKECQYLHWGQYGWKYRSKQWCVEFPECDQFYAYLDVQGRCDFWSGVFKTTFLRTTRHDVLKDYYGKQKFPRDYYELYRQIPVVKDYQNGMRCIIHWREVLKALPKRKRCPKCGHPPTLWSDKQCRKGRKYRTCNDEFSSKLLADEQRAKEQARKNKELEMKRRAEQAAKRRAEREEKRQWEYGKKQLVILRKALRTGNLEVLQSPIKE